MTTANARWALKHAWSGATDRAALALCAQALARIGVDFVDAVQADEADGVKLHGFELVEALRDGQLAIDDLRDVATREGWAARIDPRAWRFMAREGAVHGIPMALHQSNCAWANVRLADAVTAEGPVESIDLVAWLERARRAMPKPLAIGREAWQVGILFESLALARLGAEAYRRAFVALDAEAMGGTAMVRVLEALLAVREFVDDTRLDVPWRSLLADVSEGRAGVMLMGDWVRASGLALRRLEVAGLKEACIDIVDLFVPIGGSPRSPAVAAALTASDFQGRFAQVKGSAPAVADAPGYRAFAQGADVPSLTFDQCCTVRTKQALLAVVADHFVARRDAKATAVRLAEVAFGVRSST